jgi:hypothetical protein
LNEFIFSEILLLLFYFIDIRIVVSSQRRQTTKPEAIAPMTRIVSAVIRRTIHLDRIPVIDPDPAPACDSARGRVSVGASDVDSSSARLPGGRAVATGPSDFAALWADCHSTDSTKGRPLGGARSERGGTSEWKTLKLGPTTSDCHR